MLSKTIQIQRIRKGIIKPASSHRGEYEVSKRNKLDSRNEIFSVKAIKFIVNKSVAVRTGDFIEIVEDGKHYRYTVSGVNEWNAPVGRKVFYADL